MLTPLHLASSHGHIEIVQIFESNKSEIEAVTNQVFFVVIK